MTGGNGLRKQFNRRLSLDIFSYPYQSHHNSIFFSYICRAGFNRCRRELYFCECIDLGRIYWFIFLVAYLKRKRKPISEKDHFNRNANSKQNFRYNYHRIWSICLNKSYQIKDPKNYIYIITWGTLRSGWFINIGLTP